GVCALDFHGEGFLARRGVDEGDAVRLLARGGDPAPVRRAADALGRDAERDRARKLARLQVDEHEPIPGLVADVEPVSRGGRASRLAAGFQRVDDHISCRVDDAHRPGPLVRDVGEGRGEREGGKEERKREDSFHRESMRRKIPWRGKKRCLSAAAMWIAISVTNMYEVVTCRALNTA